MKICLNSNFCQFDSRFKCLRTFSLSLFSGKIYIKFDIIRSLTSLNLSSVVWNSCHSWRFSWYLNFGFCQIALCSAILMSTGFSGIFGRAGYIFVLLWWLDLLCAKFHFFDLYLYLVEPKGVFLPLYEFDHREKFCWIYWSSLERLHEI